MPKPFTVRFLALDGFWEVPGVDRDLGVWADDLITEGDRWGASKATFTLYRDPFYVWPDLRAFNKVEIETDTRCFSGQISGTPARSGDDRQIAVQIRGSQFHLDDDQYERIYVHNKLPDYRDARSFLGQNLIAPNGYIAAGNVQASDGVLLLGFPNGASLVNFVKAGAILDLGVSAGKRVVITWDSSNNDGTNSRLDVYGYDAEDTSGAPGVTADSASVQVLNNAAASGTSSVTFNTARRYILIACENNGTALRALAADIWFRIKTIQVFADTTYESGNASNLKAPVVIKDALASATVLLSSDVSQIDPANTVTTNLPALAPDEPKTPREIWEIVNAYHDYRSQIDVFDRPVFLPKPSAPIFEVGDWWPVDGQADDGDAENVYNRAIAVGRTPDGTPLRANRATGDTDSARRRALTSPAPNNPSFDINTTSWSVTGGGAAGTLTRDTTTFDSTPASGKWSSAGRGGNDAINETFAGSTFKAGTRYILTFAAKASVSTAATLRFYDPTQPGVSINQVAVTIGTGFAGFEIAWTPPVDSLAANVQFSMLAGGSAADIWVDSLRVMVPTPTLVDRQGFRRTMRLPISTPLPKDLVLANQLDDVWLADHKTIPFKGDYTVYEGAVRTVLTGETVPLELLPIRTMELLRFNDRQDPDTGGQGRDGRIVAAKWIHKEDRAEVTIDNSRSNYATLTTRLDAFLGS
jgi:hypothetical protein